MIAQGDVAERSGQQAKDDADPEDVLHYSSPARRWGTAGSAVPKLVPPIN